MSWPGLALGFRAFRLPRQGNSLEECQDAWAGDAERGRFAVADGAAESPHAALWAQLLVAEFVRQSERLPNWAQWLPSLQERWSAAASHSPAERGSEFTAVPWYLEPGLAQGAFATFLGLAIEDNRWYALAVGDSCLFQVRGDGLRHAFPLSRAADFDNNPWLLGSRTSAAEVAAKQALHGQGDWRAGDRLLLMTDALAAWFLSRVEQGGKPWHELPGILQARDPDAAFALWIDALRSGRLLRNDDVTLLVLSL